MFSDSLDGQTAVVTGASAGIGAATCRRLAAAGANVVLAARREAELAAVADGIEADYGVETLTVPTDVRKEYAVDALLSETLKAFDGIDILVNNAGSPVEAMSKSCRPNSTTLSRRPTSTASSI